jgi:hypothetical protein
MGTWFSEFMGGFACQLFQRRQDTIFEPPGKPVDFRPVHLHLPSGSDGDPFAGADGRRFVRLGMDGNQDVLNEQVFQADEAHGAVGGLEFVERSPSQGLHFAKIVHKLSGCLPVPWPTAGAGLPHQFLAGPDVEPGGRDEAHVEIAGANVESLLLLEARPAALPLAQRMGEGGRQAG